MRYWRHIWMHWGIWGAVFAGMHPARAATDPGAAMGLADGELARPLHCAPRPPSRIAENVTVVTAEEIARLNARTLEEVLQTVSGFQLFQVRTPGSLSVFTLDGSSSRHILVLMDGVPQNLLGADETAELGMIPVQRIERIEIGKGAASVAWGPALGGVINVVTRDPDPDSTMSGEVSAALGEGGTRDLRGRMGGAGGLLGYYLDGGRYRSDGLLPRNRVALDHFFAKVSRDLPAGGALWFSADFRDGDREIGRGDALLGDSPLRVDRAGSRYLSALLRMDLPLGERLRLGLLSSAGHRDIRQQWDLTAPVAAPLFDARNRTDSSQVSARLAWGDTEAGMAAGMDYFHDRIRVVEPRTGFFFLNFARDLDRLGGYLDGNYAMGPLTLLPGVRVDRIGAGGTVASSHLGATWRLSEATLLRAYGATGYSLPMPNFRDSLQRIRTLQAGFETGAVPFLWLKGTWFYGTTRNIETFSVPADYPASPVSVRTSRESRQGGEVEVRTAPWRDLSIAAGFTYSDLRDRDTGGRVASVPMSTTKLAFYYGGRLAPFRATLTGSHVNWADGAGTSVRDRRIVWDLHLSRALAPTAGLTPELFFSCRNLLDAPQYIDGFRANAPRWLEGGVRLSF